MHTKGKIMVLLAAAAISLSASSCVVNRPEQPIGTTYLCCRAVMSKNTRAEGFAETYPISQDFALWGFTLPRGKSWSNHAVDAVPIVTAKRFTGNPADSTWYCDQNIEWPFTKTINFIASSPIEAGGTYTPETGISFADYDISAASYDLMYTDYIADQVKENNVRGVAIPFNHALCKVDIKARNVVSNTRCTIYKVTIRNLHHTGSFCSLPSPEWTVTGETADCVIYESSTGTQLEPGTTATLYNAVKLLLPQALDGICMEVEYTITYTNTSIEGARETKNTPNLAGNWLTGKYYTYTLEVKSDTIDFEEIKKDEP